MAYQIHIIPGENFKHETAWLDAVGQTDGVRLVSTEAKVSVNPATGEKIQIQGYPTDAEIFFSDEGAWFPALFWRGSRATINASFEPGDEDDPAWIVVSRLTQRLSGQLQGDEGEIYDPVTGGVI